MGYVTYQLKQSWDTLEELAAYFDAVAHDFRKMKGFNEPPTNLFIDAEVQKGGEVDTICIRDL